MKRTAIIPLKYKMVIPLLLMLLAVLVYPMGSSLWVSFENYRLTALHARHFVGLANYAKIPRDARFWNAMGNTLVFVSTAVFLEFVLGFALALLLHRRVRMRNFFRSVLLTPMFITPVAVGLIFRFMLNSEFGIIPYILKTIGIEVDFFATSPLALFSIVFIDVWQWTPFMMLLLLAGLESLPREPFEAARVDGASAWFTFRSVTFPLMRPVIVVAVIIRMLDAFKVFEYLYVITRGGPGNSTESIMYYIYRVGFRFFRMGEAAAMSYVLALIILLLVFLEFQLLRRARST